MDDGFMLVVEVIANTCYSPWKGRSQMPGRNQIPGTSKMVGRSQTPVRS
jgi:hypothetical protein